MVMRKRFLRPDDPLYHPDHRRPVNRREFISQGFRAGTASVLGVSALSMMGTNKANALSSDLMDFFNPGSCDLGVVGGAKVPFICFDLAGGANISGANVLVGGPGGQRDSLSTAGYSKLGVPPDILPTMVNPNNLSSNDFIDDSLGLLFHTESAMLQGILEKTTAATQGNTNGAVIPARSDNDTGNNPHNPMYGIYQAGLQGQILQLIGSNASESGGNSMAPALMIDPEIRPTKIDRPEDARGLVDVGDLRLLLEEENDIVSVMETVKRISDFKLNLVNTGRDTAMDKELKDRISCEYLRAADTFENYPNADSVDPSADTNIVGDSGIFTQAEFDGDREFRKTASVMKLVIDGLAGAGTITMGGYDYHTGDRRTGEARDLRAGRCIGACLDYARRVGKPVMIYVFSDGSVFSNGMIETINGVDKGVWTGDNSSTAASFFLVFDPNASDRPELLGDSADEQAQHQQIGWMRSDASVETSATPAANNVNLLVETVILNYMALHGKEEQDFSDLFGENLGDVDSRRRYIAFKKLASVDDDGFI
ncbi:general secretion pathway protein GspF [Oceanicoccus sagamiensis]|uniref:General secretion pathway protein GspF n=1 Tax=Oceanicoccus sagamiensis TaxID=716816 RepID=A0A1X9N3L4_9GAMM|nr:general secretion pathway protein GspF [Oceanicoccus sagamiensis]ARN72788.1 general secretion pathway protein GspF [Oceanicoccus sagamiensis]